jgi:hypothetical protein
MYLSSFNFDCMFERQSIMLVRQPSDEKAVGYPFMLLAIP